VCDRQNDNLTDTGIVQHREQYSAGAVFAAFFNASVVFVAP
jgi:hypothetical protein